MCRSLFPPLVFSVSFSLMPHSSDQQSVKSGSYVNMTALNANANKTALSFELDKPVWQTEDSLQPFHFAPANASCAFCRPQCTHIGLSVSAKQNKYMLATCTHKCSYSTLPNSRCFAWLQSWIAINPPSSIFEPYWGNNSNICHSYTHIHMLKAQWCCLARCVWAITDQTDCVCYAWMAAPWWRQQTDTKLISNQPLGICIMKKSLLGIIPVGKCVSNYCTGLNSKWSFGLFLTVKPK